MNKNKYRILTALAVLFVGAITLNAHSEAYTPAFVDTMLEPYLQMQKKLAGDNLAGAHEAAEAFSKVMESVPDGVPSGEIDSYASLAGAIAQASDLVSARAAFHKLSVEMISLVDHNGTSGDSSIYVAYCPMAFGGKGAAWLQDDESIANPYYGAQMFRCGSIKKQITAAENPDQE